MIENSSSVLFVPVYLVYMCIRGPKRIPKAVCRHLGKPLIYYVETFANTKEGRKKTYASGDYTMQQIVDAFRLHYSTVSRAVNNRPAKNT